MADYEIGVALCGRRWGKTLGGVERLLIKGSQDPGLYWWVGLSWKSASLKRAWRLSKYFARKIWRAAIGEVPDGVIREVDKEIHLPGGLEIWLRTSQNMESLAGEGIKGVIVDEFTLMPERVWTEYIEPTLIDYDAWALLVGVPKGQNWGARMWYKASHVENWRQWRFTSYDNPYMPRHRIDKIREETPETVFQQEYLAEIIEGGVTIRNVRACVYAKPGEVKPAEGASYVMGVDWAQVQDWTVLVVMDAGSRAVVEVDRFNRIEWAVQRDRLRAMAEKWHVSQILAEWNSIGGPNIEALQAEGLPVYSFETTPSTKPALIQALILAFERQNIWILDDPVMISELEAFETERTPAGNWRYHAPAGMHDDTVIALALALEAVGSMGRWSFNWS